MKKKRKADKFMPKPTYPGGPRKMSDFIYSKLKYPTDAIEKQIKGTVRLKLEIDYTGKVIGTQIMSGLSASCDKEAKRVSQLLKFELHHKIRKGKVRYHKTLNIKFKPPLKKQESQKTKVNYNISYSTKKKTGEKKKNTSKVYSYTIKIN